MQFTLIVHYAHINSHRLTLEKDTKVPNAATVVIQREDHTIGNLLSSYVQYKL